MPSNEGELRWHVGQRLREPHLPTSRQLAGRQGETARGLVELRLDTSDCQRLGITSCKAKELPKHRDTCTWGDKAPSASHVPAHTR